MNISDQKIEYLIKAKRMKFTRSGQIELNALFGTCEIAKNETSKYIQPNNTLSAPCLFLPFCL